MVRPLSRSLCQELGLLQLKRANLFQQLLLPSADVLEGHGCMPRTQLCSAGATTAKRGLSHGRKDMPWDLPQLGRGWSVTRRPTPPGITTVLLATPKLIQLEL